MDKKEFSLQNKVFNIGAEIFNINELFNISSSLYDESDRILESLGFNDIQDIDSLEWIRHDIALDEAAEDYDQNSEDYDENVVVAEYWFDGAMQLERIDKNSNLASWLRNWYGSDETIQKKIRGYYGTPEAIYFVHGIGYDVLDADLLGGNGDGVALKMFYDFINNENAENVEKYRYKLVNDLGF